MTHTQTAVVPKTLFSIKERAIVRSSVAAPLPPWRPDRHPGSVRVIFIAYSVTLTRLFPDSSVLPHQYHFTHALYRSPTWYCSYKEDKGANPGNLHVGNALQAIWKLSTQKYFTQWRILVFWPPGVVNNSCPNRNEYLLKNNTITF